MKLCHWNGTGLTMKFCLCNETWVDHKLCFWNGMGIDHKFWNEAENKNLVLMTEWEVTKNFF